VTGGPILLEFGSTDGEIDWTEIRKVPSCQITGQIPYRIEFS